MTPTNTPEKATYRLGLTTGDTIEGRLVPAELYDVLDKGSPWLAIHETSVTEVDCPFFINLTQVTHIQRLDTKEQ